MNNVRDACISCHVVGCRRLPQVLEQLKAIDLWGRSVLTHALLSGHEKMFEAAYGAIRDDVPDEQVRLREAGCTMKV